MTSPNRWTPDQIQAARRVALAPLLKQMGYRLQPLKDDNLEVFDLPKPIIIKQHYWRSPEDGTGGNAIDLLTQVIGLSFREAIETLTTQPQTS